RQFDLKLSSNLPRTEAEMVAVRGNRAVGDGVSRGQVHAYDAAGRLTSTVDALNNIERYEYNAVGDRTRSMDKNGHGSTCKYDREAQNTKERTRPDATASRPNRRLPSTHSATRYIPASAPPRTRCSTRIGPTTARVSRCTASMRSTT